MEDPRGEDHRTLASVVAHEQTSSHQKSTLTFEAQVNETMRGIKQGEESILAFSANYLKDLARISKAHGLGTLSCDRPKVGLESEFRWMPPCSLQRAT